MLDDAALCVLHAETPLVGGEALIDQGLGFSVDLRPGDGDLVGYRARPHSGVIDLDRIGAYDPREFWDALHSTDGRLILDPGAFYILVSRESVAIPPITPPRWPPIWRWWASSGCITRGSSIPDSASARQVRARGVLEVRCHEAPFALEHGQVVGRLVYEKMAGRPERLYGQDIASNYQGQGLKLAKQFSGSGG